MSAPVFDYTDMRQPVHLVVDGAMLHATVQVHPEQRFAGTGTLHANDVTCPLCLNLTSTSEATG